MMISHDEENKSYLQLTHHFKKFPDFELKDGIQTVKILLKSILDS